MIDEGGPKDKIILEEKAANTGDNIVNSKINYRLASPTRAFSLQAVL